MKSGSIWLQSETSSSRGTNWRAGVVVAVIGGFHKVNRGRCSMNGPAAQPALELRNVSLQRGGREILRNISWTVPHGTCAAVLGPNGSGKSTLARILTGYMWPSSGDVSVD